MISCSPEDFGVAHELEAMLLEKDPSLSIGVSEVGQSMNEIILIQFVDQNFVANQKRMHLFRMHASKRRGVLPLIMKGYEIQDYAEWWPKHLPEFRRYLICPALPPNCCQRLTCHARQRAHNLLAVGGCQTLAAICCL